MDANLNSRTSSSELDSIVVSICKSSSIVSSKGIGACVHGVGHSFMMMSNNSVKDAVQGCMKLNEIHMRYYCSMGAYMEYVNQNLHSRSFYPCDILPFPGACFHYKMLAEATAARKRFSQPAVVAGVLRNRCMKLHGVYRIGCFRGIGNALNRPKELHLQLDILGLCVWGNIPILHVACIDGAMERWGRNNPTQVEFACRQLTSFPRYRQLCLEAGHRGMYDMAKDLSMYLLPEWTL